MSRTIFGVPPADVSTPPVGTLIQPEGAHLRHLERIWGTVVIIEARAGDGPWPELGARRRAIADAVGHLRWVDRVFSPFRADSIVSAIRRGDLSLAALSSQDPDHRAVLRVAAGCRVARDLTGGAFDPWATPGGFDPCGYVKGWAADTVADLLVVRGFDNCLVNAGGDISARGQAAPQRPWTVGIRHPEDASQIVHTLQVVNETVCTSGLYERGAHIVNPAGAGPAGAARSATVRGRDAGLCEALATALIVAGRSGRDWFTNLDGYSAFVIDPLPAQTAWRIEPAAQASAAPTGPVDEGVARVQG